MKGSEKQIAWANEIKEEVFGNLDCIIRNAKRNEALGSGYGGSLRYLDSVTAEELKSFVIAAFEQVDDAAVIIDNRHRYTYDALIKLGRAEAKRLGRF